MYIRIIYVYAYNFYMVKFNIILGGLTYIQGTVSPKYLSMYYLV
jgi:hypothetical protein